SSWNRSQTAPARAVEGLRKQSLRLLETPAGWSPAVAQSERCRIIFDGILYNRAELVALFADQVVPEPSDADLVGHAYRCWGEGAFRKLKGIFALVIEDGDRDLLLCARDPLG